MSDNGTKGTHITAGPFAIPVEFARWLVSQAALFVILLVILYQVQIDVGIIIAAEQTIVNAETRIIGDDQQMIANQELLMRFCNLTPFKPGN